MKSRTEKAVREALGDFLGILEYKVRHGAINVDDIRTILEAIEASGGVRATVKDQAGNADLASQLCKCCCEMKQLVTSQGYENQLRTVEQTNTLGTAISASSQRTVDAIADLKTTMVKEFCDAKERDMQEKINGLTANNALLRSQIDNASQTAAIAALLAPIQKEVDDIRCKQPQTVPVIWPNLAAVNTTPYVSGGYYQGGFNGLYGSGVPGFGGITF